MLYEWNSFINSYKKTFDNDMNQQFYDVKLLYLIDIILFLFITDDAFNSNNKTKLLELGL